jgi:DNA polymerase-3 subunit gamma/tau
MNPFVVSARKYRPATFDTVIGQSHITNTLKNAIRSNHLAQAFLFCGPRGVGKTTCARILAKTLNCRQITADFEACNVCTSCQSFNNGQSLNIYELDAASNNSVDDIRSLVEQVRFAPHAGEYKIYIIDEVHMLSSSAFNAFLKTLEEPPSYAIFILATTEKHKIIPTILSRCQIFDFNRIQVEDISRHLAYVAKGEGVEADEEALHIIAQKADGALRDALSIFDQIVSFAGNKVTYKDVINNLSILDYDYYFKVTDQIRNGDIASVLLTFNELLNDGFDGHHFVTGLASHFRDLLVSQDESTLTLLEVSAGTRERYRKQAKEIPTLHLLKYLGLCSQCDIDYRLAKNHRLHVELALIRMCSVIQVPQYVAAPVAEKKNDEPELSSATPPAPVYTQPASNTLQAPASIQPKEKEKAAALSSSVSASINPAQVKDVPVSFESKPTPPKASSLLKGTSLSSLRKPLASSSSENAEVINTASDSFEHADLVRHWNNYAEMMKKEGKHQLHATLTMSPPLLKEGVNIELVLHNLSQEELMRDERNALVEYLRRNLNNYSINLLTSIQALENDPEMAFTNKEKYQKMIEKNPHLDEFRRQLGLELEL